MAFRVEISAQAERDADAILEWLLSQHTGKRALIGFWHWMTPSHH